ncbi:MAG TPA: GUN4 domain-containing protein [Dactylosporangium sp.]|nr:GUN4 domain-containing protein [Dactylosporangium sp.]
MTVSSSVTDDPSRGAVPVTEASTPVPRSRDVAIIVGVDRNVTMATSVLSCAEADARALAELFGHLGLAADRIKVFIGGDATRAAVMGFVTDLPQRFPQLNAGDRVWFCFSGHGLIDLDGRGHLLVHDTYWESGSRLRNSVVVGEVIDRLRAPAGAPRHRPPRDKPNIVMLLDACRSRPATRGRSADLNFANALRALIDTKPSGTVVISGCPEGQLSFEDHERGLGLLTAAFVDLMTPPSRPRTLAELNSPLAQRVLARSRELNINWRQSPTIMAEPAELVEGLLLAPQLLHHADIVELHSHSREIQDDLSAAMLFENLSHAAVHTEAADLFTGPLRRRIGGRRRQRPASSASALDLDKLDDLIRHGRLRDADRETLRLVLQSAGRDPQSIRTHLLSPDDVAATSVDDLLDIDECWRRHSGGRFGFLAQLEAAELAAWDATAFANRVGWHPREHWVYYAEARWTSAAPPGHLPILGPAGGIEPPWRITAGSYGHVLAEWAAIPGAVIRQARDSATVNLAHSAPIPEPFTWREYLRLERAHVAETLVGAGHGRIRPLGGRLSEAPVRSMFSSKASFLSAVWAYTRVTLLRRLADESSPAISADGDRPA